MTQLSYDRSESRFINKTLLYMALGLLITFVVGFYVSNNSSIAMMVYSNSAIVFGAIILELSLVVILSRKISKFSSKTAFAIFLAYSAINGITFGAIFIMYELSSIASIFIVAAAMFFCCSMIGITTKKDLSLVGRVSIMAVVGILITSILNIFIGSQGLYTALSYVGVVVFCALTAYDMQKVKLIHQNNFGFSSEEANKFAIIAALQLYLDFINLFIYLLRIFGKKR